MSAYTIDETLAKVDQSAMHLHRERVIQKWLVLQLGPGPWRSADVARERARLMAGWQLARSKGIHTVLDTRPRRQERSEEAAPTEDRPLSDEVRTCAAEECEQTFQVPVSGKSKIYCGSLCSRRARRDRMRDRSDTSSSEAS